MWRSRFQPVKPVLAASWADGNGICPVDVGPLGHGERDGSVPGDGGGEEACAGLGGDGSRALSS